MKKSIPRVLFVFNYRKSDTSTLFGGFVQRLKKRGGLENIDVHYVALEDLIFEIVNGETSVIDQRTGERLDSFDWVYFKSWIAQADKAASLAVYLEARGIPFIDNAVTHKGSPSSKLYANLKFWAHDIVIPNTLYASPNHIKDALLSTSLAYPLVMKDVYGQKGMSNYLVNTYDEALQLLDKNPDVDFIVQEYVPNTHDYRIQVYGGKSSLIIKRMAQEGSHLNNTSAGGGAQLVPLDEIDPEVLKIAERAAEAVELQISGVDVLPHETTGKLYILEANQGSQVVTGKFTDENMAAFNTFVASHAKVRMKRENTAKSKLSIIGRHEVVDLPDFGIVGAHAKVDTGAYRSSIHAHDIRLVDGVLHFRLPSVARQGGEASSYKDYSTTEFDTVPVRKSSTYVEHRYIIRTRLRIGSRQFVTSFTLTDRGSMRFPVLIGRKVLRSRFLVNPELSYQKAKES